MTRARELAELATSYDSGSSMGFRNRIINGDMRIDQRNNGASVTPISSQYTVDRFAAALTAASKFSFQQNAGAVTPPAGFTNYLGATSLSAYSVLTSDFFGLQQKIEGFNVADLGWGATNAQAVTVSFWVRSSLTGTFGGAVYNVSGTRSYPFSYTISAANTWEQKTITIAGDTSGTWPKDNTTGMFLNFSLGAGTTYSGTAGAWAGALYTQPTGATSVVGTSGATFYITGVQLEAGTVATPFERRDYGRELMMCYRYYQKLGNSSYATLGSGLQINTTSAAIAIPLLCAMRAAPTSTFASLIATDRAGFDAAVSDLTLAASTTNVYAAITFSTAGAGFRPILLAVANTTSGYVAFSAEL